MKPLKRKIKRKVDADELGALLRTLADAVDGEADDADEELAGLLGGFSKLSLSVKRKAEEASVEIKVETESELAELKSEPESKPEPEGKPTYKKLKKRVNKTFKAIKETLAMDELPEASVIESFVSDSELMISYPGYGDENYGAYKKACKALKSAFDKKDIAKIKTRYEAIKQLQEACHSEYK